MDRQPRDPESGTTLIETMIATTLFAVFSVAMLSAGSTFSQVDREQYAQTSAHLNGNVTRGRILADAAASDSALCADASTFSLSIAGGATLVEYYVSDGNLMRWSLPPDKESLVAENVTSLGCFGFGPAGILVAIDLGTIEDPYHVSIRISDSGAVP